MRWEDERYVRLFTRDTTTWLMWSWQARFVFMSLLRKVDRAGMLDVGPHGVRGLAVAIGVPAEIVESGIAELLSDHTVKRAGSTFVVPNFLVAQETSQSDKARQAAKRERDRLRTVQDASVTPRDGAVTPRDAESRSVTDSHDVTEDVTPGHAASLQSEPSVLSQTEPCLAVEPPTPLPGVAAIAVQKSTPTTRVFDHWRSAMGSPRSVLDGKRRKRIDWAIETYDEATCIQAIDGCRADPFSMGENDRGAKFNALELIFRDAEHVEKFREIGKAATAPPARDVDDLPPLVDPSKLPTPEQLRANLAALDEIRRSSPFAAKEAQSA